MSNGLEAYTTETRPLNPLVWGPHYWFVMHTMAFSYPVNPPAGIKKQYYAFIQSLPIFVPEGEVRGEIERLLAQYPVEPYLGSKDALVRWTHFIHNKVNQKLDRPEVTMRDFYISYFNLYKTDDERSREMYKQKTRLIFGAVLVALLAVSYYMHDK